MSFDVKFSLWDDSIKKSKDINHIEYLAFSGGGTKGISYIGVIEALHKLKILENVKVFSGSSVGSLFCLLAILSCESKNYNKISYDDMIDLTKKILKIQNTSDNIFTKINDFYKLWKKMGKYEYSMLYDIVCKIFKQVNIDKNISMKEFSKLTNKRIIISVSVINKGEVIYFSDKTYPDFKLSHVITMSMLHPVYFCPYTLENKITCNDICIDGGVYNNLPINVFDIYHNDRLIAVNRRALCFVLINDSEYVDKYEINNISDYLFALLNSYHSKIHQLRFESEYFWERCIPIECGKISSCKFDVDKLDIKTLIKNGYDSTLNILSKRVEKIDKAGFPIELFIRTSVSRINKLDVCDEDISKTISCNENIEVRETCEFNIKNKY